MQKLNKKHPSILSNLILKKEIADKLANELNVDKNFIYVNSDLFMNYAVIELEILLYGGVVPYKDLEHYRKLLRQKHKVISKLHEKIKS